MTTQNHFTSRHRSWTLLLCLSLLFPSASAQDRKAPPPSGQTDDVVRISTELVQTDVMVFDGQGKFVDGLRPEQFELRVDGKPQTISFFERIEAGSGNEDLQIAAARGGVQSAAKSDQVTVRPLDRGRAIFFYLDDLHLAPDSINRTREMLAQFIEKEMGQNDLAGLYTASGQLGILQQLTNEKIVLQTALKRLQPRPYEVRDNERTPMTEYQALAIERNDRAVLDYFIEQMSRDQGMQSPQGARTTTPLTRSANVVTNRLEATVKSRARAIIEQSAHITRNTLSGLENLINTSSPIPGRKLLFFISDGFFIDQSTSSTVSKLSHITHAAARSGTVIYSVEARGLMSGMAPANERTALDPAGRLASVNLGAATAQQEALHKLAVDTGGRALLNSNAPARGLVQALKETSAYYLLAWRPETAGQSGGKFQQIDVNLKGRADLTVRVRSGFLLEAPEQAIKPKPAKSKSDKLSPEDADLVSAISALYPKRALPTALAIGYLLNAPNKELMLMASVQVDASALGVNSSGGGGDAQKMKVDVVGVLINDQGKAVSDFEQRLTIDPSRISKEQQRRIVYSHVLRVTPGLYQMRVAARDEKSGRTGSASQWIEIPDVTRGGFSLGSLFIGEMQAGAGPSPSTSPQALVNVARRFPRNSRVLYQTIVYNASKGTTAPDVALQVQVFRDGQPVITVPLRRLLTDGLTELAYIPFEDDFSLGQLPPGRYVLQVTAIDRLAKTSSVQRLNFEIE
jgi:VWFA-related protein